MTDPGAPHQPEGTWRVAVRARAAWLRTNAVVAARERGCAVDGSVVTAPPNAPDEIDRAATLARQVVRCADEAEAYANATSSVRRWLSGSLLEGAWANLHGGEEYLLRLLPDDEVAGYLPVLGYETARYLRHGDPRRIAVEARIRQIGRGRGITRGDRTAFSTALNGVHLRNATAYMRMRSLRNSQLGFAAAFVVLALALIGLAVCHPVPFSLCLPASAGPDVCPTGRAVPSGGDLPLVALVGLLGAAVSATRAVTGTARGATPYSVVVGQALLKTVLGSVTAVIGVWFLRAGFVPGVNDVDSQAEILVYAVVFGYAQQVITRLIDQRAADATAAVPAPPGGPPGPANPDLDPDGAADADPDAPAAHAKPARPARPRASVRSRD